MVVALVVGAAPPGALRGAGAAAQPPQHNEPERPTQRQARRHDLGGRYVLGEAPRAREISLGDYRALKEKYSQREHRRKREEGGWRSYDLMLDAFDEKTATVAIVTQFRSKAWEYVERFQLQRTPESDKELGIPDLLARRAKVIGGIRYGMTVREVFAKKGRDWKSIPHQDMGSATLVFDDVIIHVVDWHGGDEGRVVGVRPVAQADKEPAR